MTEVETLRAANASLKQRIGELEHAALLTRQPWRRSLYLGESDLRKLITLARAAAPRVVPSDVDIEALAIAFAFTQTLYRTDAPDRAHYVSHWADRCADWCAANNANSEHAPGFVFVAALCHGDVPYTLPDSSLGIMGALGLAQYGGRPASPRYRDVLAGRAQLLRPTPPPARQQAPQVSQVLIVGGNQHVGPGRAAGW